MGIESKESIFKKIGILIPPYLKIGGKIKAAPEDFIVREVINGKILNEKANLFSLFLNKLLLSCSRKKRFLWFTLVKRDIGTLEVAGLLQKRGIKKVWFCGLKDKKAVVAQKLCIYSKDKNKLFKIKSKKFFFKDFEYKDKRVRLGSNDGNYFIIRIRDVSALEQADKIDQIKDRIPNFFGPQRFGSIKLNNHLIGKAIIKREWERACFEILRSGVRGIDEKLRKKWGDWSGIREIIPKFRRGAPEWLLINNLCSGSSFEDAVLQLPKEFLRLWIDAYQSYLFNLTLSEIIKRNIEAKRVPLVAYNLKLEKWGEIGKIISQIMKRESLSLLDLKIRKKLRPKVRLRKVYMGIEDLKIKREKRDLILEFFLERGSYATVFLYFVGVPPEHLAYNF